MRIDKFLSSQGFGSRSICKKIIKDKRVVVNNCLVTKDDFIVNPVEDIIEVDKKVVKYIDKIYIMLNKPSGYITATKDNFQKTVMDLITDYKFLDLFPVGRLDIDTEGLLLITNDGTFSHELMSPKKHVNKKYYVMCEKTISDEDIKHLEKPIDLKDFITLPGAVDRIGAKEIYLTINEGKFHQVKRMIESINNKVIYLKRVAMGSLNLDPDLKPGQYRLLSVDELAKLK